SSDVCASELAGHEAEVPRSGGRDEARLGGACELLDDIEVGGRFCRQRTVQRSTERLEARNRPDGTIAMGRDVIARELEHTPERALRERHHFAGTSEFCSHEMLD